MKQIRPTHARDIVKRGYDAFHEGAEEWQSPYSRGEAGYLEWRDGWRKAEAESQAKAHA